MLIGLICDGNPGIGACELLAAALNRCGAEVTLICSVRPHNKNLGWLPLGPREAAASDLLHSFAAVGVFLEGDLVAILPKLHQQAAALRQRDPVFLFSGPIRPLCGDALNADLLERLNYDLLCLQGDMQANQLQWLLRGTPHEHKPISTIGLWCLPTRPVGHRQNQQPLLVVLDQPHTPPSPLANAFLYERLCNAARNSPSWQIRLQPDGPLSADPSQWPETSICWHHFHDQRPPANVQRGQPEELEWAVAQASSCLGLGSDWLLSAVVWGKSTAVLGDYGIRTEFNGPVFFGSGLMHRLADCLPLDQKLPALPAANPGWLDDLGWSIADGPQRLLRQVVKCLP